jgi:hypothetical protein
MNNKTWSNSICIASPDSGVQRTVRTIGDAKVALHCFWPAYHGSEFARAERACDQALEGKSDPAEARRAFIAAAVEAHFRIH